MDNKTKILEISKKLGLSHVGSNLSCLPILEEIYKKKKPEDIVILDNAHAHLAHLVAMVPDYLKSTIESMEKGLLDKNIMGTIKKYGIHCDRQAGCDASGGSLGHSVGIGIGMAIADKTRTIYVIISDGSSCEGTLGESLRIAYNLGLNNLKIHANFNSYTATSTVDLDYFESFIKGYQFPVIFHRTNNGLEELDGVKGHYKVYEKNDTKTIRQSKVR